MAQLTIYGSPLSTYVRTVRMVCEEKGIAYELVPAAPHSPEIDRLHPFGRVPAMTHGDFVLYESAAIARYLDESFAGPALRPKDARARARMEQWIGVAGDYLYGDVIRRVVLQYVFAKGGKPDRATIDAALPNIRHELGVLDRAYGAKPYILGDEVSLADLFIAPIVFYLGRAPEGPALLRPHAGVRRAMAAIAARPSFERTAPPLPPQGLPVFST